ncbi:unnamed protein product, partial [Heterosigma akashiwo]
MAGNVEWLVANGTVCEMHSLGWDNNPDAEAQLHQLVSNAKPGDIVQIDQAPDFINVKLTNRTGVEWPPELNLSENKAEIIIPIKIHPNPKENWVKVGSTKLFYKTHAVTPSFAMTCHKLQGQTKQYILLLLEKIPGKKLTYETLYVIVSRVPGAHRLRCLPLSSTFTFDWSTLAQLRPDIFKVKYRMDIHDGFWDDRD